MIGRAGRRRQGDSDQLAHPHRAGRDVRPRRRSSSKGRLLAVGTRRRNSTRHTAAAHRSSCESSAAAAALRWLAGRTQRCASDRHRRRDCAVSARRRSRHEADLLKRHRSLAGFRVASFGSTLKSLEDVFMQVTEGKSAMSTADEICQSRRGIATELGAVGDAADRSLDGIWLLDSVGDRLNPILIKEARQALKSRQFTLTFRAGVGGSGSGRSWDWRWIGPACVLRRRMGRDVVSYYYLILAFAC